MTRYKLGLIFAVATILITLSVQNYLTKNKSITITPTVQFENKTNEFGLLKYGPSFSVAVSDFDRDGIDDLFVGHHGYPPSFYLNKQTMFVEAKDIHPIKKRDDRHGYTFVDFDNDGDQDFVYAAGGADGIGKGSANKVYRNLLSETGKLEFSELSEHSDIAHPKKRSRHFLPIANISGSKVDLYLTSRHLHRQNSTNLYAINNSDESHIKFAIDNTSSLALGLESNGKDIFFDFDRDGDADFLHMGDSPQVRLYQNRSGTFYPFPSLLDKVTRVISVVSADLNNDGFPDLYFGGTSGQSHSDNISSNDKEIHFSIKNQRIDFSDTFSFSTEKDEIGIDFIQHIPSDGKARVDPSDIYIGAERANPKSRKTSISQLEASDKPQDTRDTGIYIWYEKKHGLWHILWKHKLIKRSISKGIIYSQGIKIAEKKNLETYRMRSVSDYMFMNMGGKTWKDVSYPGLKHNEWTYDLSAADFNNDGFIDIVGTRTRDDAKPNSTPFIQLNHGKLQFSTQAILDNTEDDIFRADAIVHGFFNEDGLPDIFYTNGSGLLPSHKGPYQFWLNTSAPENDYVLLELEGTRSNRDAIGAQIELYDMNNRLLGYRELGPNYGRSQDTHKVHFGLGNKKAPFKLQIRWPGQRTIQEEVLEKTGFHKILQD